MEISRSRRGTIGGIPVGSKYKGEHSEHIRDLPVKHTFGDYGTPSELDVRHLAHISLPRDYVSSILDAEDG